MPIFLNTSKYSGSNILVVAAHTDDADFNCGATVNRLASAGANVVYVVCTRGEKGTKNRELTTDELVRVRREEQQAANEILGVSETIHFDYPDGELTPSFELQGKITCLIRRFRPALMFTFDPSWPEHRQHPDHRACAIAALRANSFSALIHYFPEQLEDGIEPYQCPEMLLFDTYRRADTFVPVGSLFRKKFDALFTHESQIEHLLEDRYKKLLDNVLKIPSDIVIHAIVGAFVPQFLVESFRTIRAGDILR